MFIYEFISVFAWNCCSQSRINVSSQCSHSLVYTSCHTVMIFHTVCL